MNPPDYTPSTPEPADFIRLADVPQFLQQYGVHVSRATIFNWVKYGKRGRKLQTTQTGISRSTTPNWLREFLASYVR